MINGLFFSYDPHNVRLGLALDGVNPYRDLSSCHFTWHVILLNYNLPPWLITKHYFLMLVLTIPKRESVTSTNVDLYLQPLIDKLQLLWIGVKPLMHIWGRHSASKQCVWNIHDFLTYGLFARCVTKGHMGCPHCGPTTEA